MEIEDLTACDLEYIRRLCEASEITGVNWPRAVLLFPAQTEVEECWKRRMLLGISLVRSQSSPGPDGE